MNTRFAKLACFSVFVVAQVCHTHAQTAASPTRSPSLQRFVQELVEHYDPSSLPSYGDLRGVKAQISGAPAQDIASALPSIFLALRHNDATVRVYAVSTLASIGDRPDSALLLREYLAEIASLLNFPDERLQKGAVVILGGLKPNPPSQIVGPLVKALREKNGDRKLQVVVLYELLHNFPADPEIIGAVETFMSWPLDASTRVSTLNAIQASFIKHPRIAFRVSQMLDYPGEGVKIEAIKTLRAMGNDALLQAEPRLKELAQKPDESPEVKAEAAKALQAISR